MPEFSTRCGAGTDTVTSDYHRGHAATAAGALQRARDALHDIELCALSQLVRTALPSATALVTAMTRGEGGLVADLLQVRATHADGYTRILLDLDDPELSESAPLGVDWPAVQEAIEEGLERLASCFPGADPFPPQWPDAGRIVHGREDGTALPEAALVALVPAEVADRVLGAGETGSPLDGAAATRALEGQAPAREGRPSPALLQGDPLSADASTAAAAVRWDPALPGFVVEFTTPPGMTPLHVTVNDVTVAVLVR